MTTQSRALLRMAGLFWRAGRRASLLGLALSLTVLAAGTLLLGLSGWFITATAAAGLAGLGAVFDVFRPAAAVRFLALTRTAARYGERLTTHEATLRALAELRVTLLARLAAAPWARLEPLRAGRALTRLTADVDVLDGLPLRVLLPGAVFLLVQGAAALALAQLTSTGIALWIFGTYLLGAAAVLIYGAGRGANAAAASEELAQDLRARVVDLLRLRRDLAVQGRLQSALQALTERSARVLHRQRQVVRADRGAGFLVALTLALALSGALWLGGTAVETQALSPAQAALGLFAALALAETLTPLRRLAAELGRMGAAAQRVDATLDLAEAQDAPLSAAPLSAEPNNVRLRFAQVTARRPGAQAAILDGLSFELAAGETLALTGASGCGKSTALLLAARFHQPDEGQILLDGADISSLPASSFRQRLAYLPQRAHLMAGSVFEALALANPDLSTDEAWALLRCVGLEARIAQRGGLEMRLGEAGAGLSGGEARRLCLARVLARRPDVLLLDEPTEGLDQAMAETVLRSIRALLPDAAILCAAHRPAERAWADRCLGIG